MDELGVFIKSYGIKPQGKSSPMSTSKSTTKPSPAHRPINPDPPHFRPNNTPDAFDIESIFKGSMNFNSNNDDLLWGFNAKTNTTTTTTTSNDDLLSSDPVHDFFGSFGSARAGSKGVLHFDGDDDLLPGFGVSTTTHHRAQAGSRQSRERSAGSSSSLEELEDFMTGGTKNTAKGHLNGFSATKEAKNTGSSCFKELEDFVTDGTKNTAKGHLNGFSATKEAKKTGSSSLEELEDFVTGGTNKIAKGHLNGFSAPKEAMQASSSFDDFDTFVMGGTKKTDKGHSSGISAKEEAKRTVSQKSQQANFIDIEGSFNDDSVHTDKLGNVSDLLFPEEATDLDTFFGAHIKKNVHVTEDTFMNTQTDGVPDLFSETPFTMEKKVPPSGFPDDFSSMFGGVSTSAVFEEIEGESEERRRARLGRYQRASARMAQALAEMNEREYQAQQEQEEKHRIADAMDVEMKQWAAGKEGNLRALLSSLQQVLAPELGWRPVTLTDLITSSQVKIAYKKAALCVHPDKVQQKGASLHQKFVAEKVFDLLKEAWNKFNAEELR